ncbi:hypothetical protein JCM14076_06630 [Methylosoma difficile]
MIDFALKQGGKFQLPYQFCDDRGVGQSLEGITLTSQLRGAKGNLIATLDVIVVDELLGLYLIDYPHSTLDWPDGKCYFDIKESAASYGPLLTDTFSLLIERAETRL